MQAYTTSIQGALDPKFKKPHHAVQPLNLSTILYGRASPPSFVNEETWGLVVKQAAKVIG